MLCVEIRHDDQPIIPSKTIFDIYRVPNESVVKFIIPAGHPYNQFNTALVVKEGNGKEYVLPAERTAIGGAVCEWKPQCCGPATLSLRCDEINSPEVTTESPTATVLVSPDLDLNGHKLKPSSLCVCSVIAARLGPLNRWADVLAVVKRQKFNAIHLTPIQVLGESSSSYSLADQMSISPRLTDGGWEAVSEQIKSLRAEYHMFFFEDLVLNHTASNSPFLKEHPEAACNEENSPWLRGAIELDNAIKDFTQKVVKGQIPGCGCEVRNEDELSRLVKAFKEQCLNPFNLGRFFRLNNTENKKLMDTTQRSDSRGIPEHEIAEVVWEEILKHIGESSEGILLPREMVNAIGKCDYQRLDRILGFMNEKLRNLQGQVYNSIVSAFEGTVRYERVQCHKGPVTGTPWNSFVPWYFTPIQTAEGKTLHLANNGWVMDWDARKDFTAAGTLVYLKRSLLAWSDCVKLRYGTKPEESPVLWERMGEYCRKVASVFDGVRLDNCHSTPLAVGQYMLRQARSVNPNLFVFAELFTGSQEADALFERELGLDALVREAVQTSSPGDCAYHALKFTNCPLGSLQKENEVHSVCQREGHQLICSRATNLFYDCTHDNETPFQKGRIQDTLACAALVCASNCAVGSTLGYEVLMKSNPSVVDDGVYYKALPVIDPHSPKKAESDTALEVAPKTLRFVWRGPASSVQVWSGLNNWREGMQAQKTEKDVFVWEAQLDRYPPTTQIEFKFVVDGTWTTSTDYKTLQDSNGNVNNIICTTEPLTSTSKFTEGPGIVEGRRALNEIHQRISQEGYNEITVQWPADDFQIIERHNRFLGRAVYFFIRSCWWRGPDIPSKRDVTVAGKILEQLMCCTLAIDQKHFGKSAKTHDNKLNGIGDDSSCLVSIFPPSAHYDASKDLSYLNFSHFPSGSVYVVAVKVERPEAAISAAFGLDNTNLKKAVAQLSLSDINYLLWSCEEEERDRSGGVRGVYQFPGVENSVYAGFAGAVAALDLVHSQALVEHVNHPVYKNIMDGPWLVDYHATRVAALKSTATSEAFKSLIHTVMLSLQNAKQPIWRVSGVDYAFCAIYRELTNSILDRLPQQLNACKEPLVWRLAIAATHVHGEVRTSSLWPDKQTPTLSAGLPFFSREYMREWGRDTFLALPGILCTTHRWADAKEEILAYASLLRHAMIPNLMDSGNNPRYNARDAVWFWLYAVQLYVRYAPDGVSLLTHPVKLRFDHGLKYTPPAISTIRDMIHSILSSHYTGIEFREWNAGFKIDSQMKDEGFNVKVSFDAATGFCLGGNRFNCGTWMDKMGSSEKAGNKGIPASPRDGAPVELTCALYSTLEWIVDDLIPNGLFPYAAAFHCQGGTALPYADWKQRINDSFSKSYLIDGAAAAKYREVAIEGSYRDTYGSRCEKEDYYLRCNYAVGLAMAPRIDEADKMKKALEIAYRELVGDPHQVGMKTLNPGNPKYRPNYDNANDSMDIELAHGWNYHQGPEWVWPLGYWYQARWLIAEPAEKIATLYQLTSQLKNVRNWIEKRPWFSLPELMDRDGNLCIFSCQSQAWSVGSFLHFFGVCSQGLSSEVWSRAPTILVQGREDAKHEALPSHEIETEAPLSPLPASNTVEN